MRDPASDAAEMARRRELLLETGFRLFAHQTIESVKLQDIAAESGVGIATLYRYFETKQNLVIEIGAKKWREYYLEEEEEYLRRNGSSMTAAEEMEYYLDCFIDLYRNHKDLLRFNRNFDSYVKHEGCTAEQMRHYNEAVNVFAGKFHSLCLRTEKDGTLNIRQSERKLFVSTMYIMLSAAGKFAEGLIYPPDEDRDMSEELIMLKNMILNNCRTGS